MPSLLTGSHHTISMVLCACFRPSATRYDNETEAPQIVTRLDVAKQASLGNCSGSCTRQLLLSVAMHAKSQTGQQTCCRLQLMQPYNKF